MRDTAVQPARPGRRGFAALLLVLASLVGAAGLVATDGIDVDWSLGGPLARPVTGPIVYAQAGDLVLANPDGSQPRPLTAGTAEDDMPTWSPDGTRIAFWSGEPVPGAGNRRRYSSAGLWVVDADGGRRRQVVARGGDFLTFDLVWAPDGRQLAFVEPTGELMVVDLDSGRVAPVAGGGGFFPQDPRWSPDASMIAFNGARDVGNSRIDRRLYVVASDGTGLTPVTRQVHADPNMDFELGPINWSRDSSALLYSFPRGDRITNSGLTVEGRDILVARRAGQQWVEAPLLQGRMAWQWAPALSNDGTRIAFLRSSFSSDGFTVWTVAADGSNPRPGPDSIFLGDLCWTPDDTAIVALVQTVMNGGEQVVRMLDPDGQRPSIDLPIPAGSNLRTCSMWQRTRS